MSAEESVHALREALEQLDVSVQDAEPDSGADLMVNVQGQQALVQLKRYSLIDQPRARDIAARLTSAAGLDRKRPRVVTVVVADRIVAGAREEFRRAHVSWLDLRGHLYLRGPGLLVDAPTVPTSTSHTSGRTSTGVRLAVAVDVLLHAQQPVSIRETARRVGAAPSSVSASVKALREDGLLQGAVVDAKALFWDTAPRWRPTWHSINRLPEGKTADNRGLAVNRTDLREPGWALTGDVAAALLGAPIALSAKTAPDFYLPAASTHRLARAILGHDSSSGGTAARLAVAPIIAACQYRSETHWRGERWGRARVLFVALELARDPGRGSEILRDWQPPQWSDRVW